MNMREHIIFGLFLFVLSFSVHRSVNAEDDDLFKLRNEYLVKKDGRNILQSLRRQKRGFGNTDLGNRATETPSTSTRQPSTPPESTPSPTQTTLNPTTVTESPTTTSKSISQTVDLWTKLMKTNKEKWKIMIPKFPGFKWKL